MTRDEAIRHYKFLKEEWVEMDIEEYTEFIFEHFESRKCKNCKYYEDGGYTCLCIDTGVLDCTDDFGCNRFERR